MPFPAMIPLLVYLFDDKSKVRVDRNEKKRKINKLFLQKKRKKKNKKERVKKKENREKEDKKEKVKKWIMNFSDFAWQSFKKDA